MAGAIELSKIDGKPLDAAVLRRMRAVGNTCLALGRQTDGTVKVAAILRRDLPFDLPAAHSVPGTAPGRAEAPARKEMAFVSAAPGAPGFVLSCVVPASMSSAEFATMVRTSASKASAVHSWRFMARLLVAGATVTPELRAGSREAAQVTAEWLGVAPSSSGLLSFD